MSSPQPTTKPSLRILGLDPGTHEIGWALLAEGAVAAFGVHTLPYGLPVPELLRDGLAFVEERLASLQPNLIAIEHTFWVPARRAAILRILTSEMKRVAREHRVKVLGYSPTHIKKTITGHGHATKPELAAAVLRAYPSLADSQAKSTSETHWDHIFDAVAVALTALHECQ